MSVILGVLEEERERLGRAIPLYLAMVEKQPRGAIWIKKRGKREYAYLAYREGGKVRFKYVAPIPSLKYQVILLKIKERDSLLIQIRNMRKDLRVIERTLRISGRSK